MSKHPSTTPAPQTTSSAVSIPDWLSNASQSAIGTATDLSNRQYTPYTGEQVAGPSADTVQAQQQVRDMQGQYDPAYTASQNVYQGLLGQAAPITASGVNDTTSGLYQTYPTTVMNPAQGLLGGSAAQGPATAGQVASNASTIMSPYSQQVINPALQAGQQQLALAKQGISGNAANVGAFGGSRQGVQEGVADAQTSLGTMQQIGNMLNTGWNSALTPATQVALQGGQQGLTAAQQLATMGQQGYQNAQSAAGNIAQLNQAQGMTAAAALPGVAAAQQQADTSLTGLLGQSGIQQQTQQQTVDNSAMGNFYAQQNWPVQNLDLLLGAVGSVPYGTSTDNQMSAPASAQKNMAGSILGGAATGASTGAVAGPWGAAIGAGVGGLLGAFS